LKIEDITSYSDSASKYSDSLDHVYCYFPRFIYKQAYDLYCTAYYDMEAFNSHINGCLLDCLKWESNCSQGRNQDFAKGGGGRKEGLENGKLL